MDPFGCALHDPYFYLHPAGGDLDNFCFSGVHGFGRVGDVDVDVDVGGGPDDVENGPDDVENGPDDVDGPSVSATNVDGDVDGDVVDGDVDDDAADNQSAHTDSGSWSAEPPPLEYLGDSKVSSVAGFEMLPEIPEAVRAYSDLTWTFERHADVMSSTPQQKSKLKSVKVRRAQREVEGEKSEGQFEPNDGSRFGCARRTRRLREDDGFAADLAQCTVQEFENVLPAMLESKTFHEYDHVLAYVETRMLNVVLKEHNVPLDLAMSMKQARRRAKNRLYQRSSRARKHTDAPDDEGNDEGNSISSVSEYY